jgi:hypothetical protein
MTSPHLSKLHLNKLAHLRTRLALLRSGHMLLGAGCSCGLSAGHIDIGGVDAMIGAHLADKYRDAGRQALARVLDRARAPDSLGALLGELVDGTTHISEGDAADLCDDLDISIGSLEEATGASLRRGPRIESL